MPTQPGFSLTRAALGHVPVNSTATSLLRHSISRHTAMLAWPGPAPLQPSICCLPAAGYATVVATAARRPGSSPQAPCAPSCQQSSKHAQPQCGHPPAWILTPQLLPGPQQQHSFCATAPAPSSHRAAQPEAQAPHTPGDPLRGHTPCSNRCRATQRTPCRT